MSKTPVPVPLLFFWVGCWGSSACLSRATAILRGPALRRPRASSSRLTSAVASFATASSVKGDGVGGCTFFGVCFTTIGCVIGSAFTGFASLDAASRRCLANLLCFVRASSSNVSWDAKESSSSFL